MHTVSLSVIPCSNLYNVRVDSRSASMDPPTPVSTGTPTGTDTVVAYPDFNRMREHMIAGGLAGSISTVCTYPLDLARSRLAVIPKSRDAHQNRTFALFNYLKAWYRIGGIRELYRYSVILAYTMYSCATL